MTITKFNATFTDQIFTTTTQAIISTIDAQDFYTEIVRIQVTDLGTLAAPDEDQEDIMDGLNNLVAKLAAKGGQVVTGTDGDGDNLFWEVALGLPIDLAAAKHQKAVATEREARAVLYDAVREQVRQGMPLSHVAIRAGITRVTVDRVLRK